MTASTQSALSEARQSGDDNRADQVPADTYWVTDAELIRRLGLPEKVVRQTVREMDTKPGVFGFPQKQARWGNRRYWPAVQAWFEREYGLKMQGITRIRRAS